ncbi:acyltransferase [Pantoea sp. BAV 3049]|uniref:acyltransferase family protein n=1 Tax=Pantoea sp. BAV 3049 TaxID=2654188 RepID=UPI00131A8CA7|nr:acyltransferase [Pantoea sp. BAV 3049]
MSDHKISSLDGLRGIAAITVIFSHITVMFYPYLHAGLTANPNPSNAAKILFNSPFTFFYKGTSAVMLFFVMSGFVLSYSIIRKGFSPDFLKTAVIRRYLRLNIPVIASIFICLILVKLGSFRATEFGIKLTLSWAYTSDKGILEALKQAIYGSIILGKGTFNYVLWTINIEFFGSLLVYFLIVFLGHNIFLLRMACLAISACTLTNSVPFVWGMGLFPAGVLLATFNVKSNGSLVSIIISAFTLLIGLYLYGFNSESSSYHYINMYLDYLNNNGFDIPKGFIVSIIGVIMVISCFCINASVFRLLESSLCRWLGKISYSVYLTHTLVLAIFAPYVIHYFGLGFSAILLCATIVIPVTVLASWAFCEAFDVTAINNSKKIAILINDFCESKKERNNIS